MEKWHDMINMADTNNKNLADIILTSLPCNSISEPNKFKAEGLKYYLCGLTQDLNVNFNCPYLNTSFYDETKRYSSSKEEGVIMKFHVCMKHCDNTPLPEH